DSSGDGDTGGGIANQGTVTMRNSVVAGNVDGSGGTPDCEAVTSLGHNIIGDDTGCAVTPATGDQVGTGAAPIDPKLGPLADNGGPTPTHALLAGSTAIDAGGSDAAPTDQRGVPRAAPDIGAYELALCQDVVINRVGSGAADVLTGTDGADGFLPQGGDDTVNGLGGDDAACLGDGNDSADAGPGKDVVSGEAGNDAARLGAGKDTATGGEGNDRLTGGGGKDLLKGEAGKDKLRGQGGKDRLRGGPGKDTCNGGGGGKDKGACEKERKIP
ncbi:MAG: choice-of-anchor Q domain-containing protein, partial [Actinomycetota bacterium]